MSTKPIWLLFHISHNELNSKIFGSNDTRESYSGTVGILAPNAFSTIFRGVKVTQSRLRRELINKAFEDGGIDL